MNSKKTPKISVLCATAPKPNPGMSSVDLAFHAFAQRHNLSEYVTFYQYVLSSEIHSGKKLELLTEIQKREELPIQYHCYRDRLDEIFASDVIIFWGDFTHIHDFTKVIAERLQKVDASISFEDAQDSVYQHLFFEGAPDEVLEKTIIFGESLLFNNVKCYQDERYRTVMQRLLNKCAGAFLRDPISAMDAKHLAGRYDHGMLGVDCSQLLSLDDIEKLPRSASASAAAYKDNIGVFFGRSDDSISALGRFSKYVATAMGKECVWIPWWYSRGSSRDLKKVKRGNRKLLAPAQTDFPLVGDLYQMIQSSSLVITDTYHVALNSWKMGVPAVCIGQGYSRKKSSSVNSGDALAQRDKRQIFYFTHQLADFFSYIEEVETRSLAKQRAQHVVSILEDQALLQSKIDAIRAHAKSAEEDVCKVIDTLLA